MGACSCQCKPLHFFRRLGSSRPSVDRRRSSSCGKIFSEFPSRTFLRRPFSGPPFFRGYAQRTPMSPMSIALARYIRLYVTCSAPCSCNNYCRNVFRDSVQISALNVFTSSKCRRPGVAVQIFLVVWILATQRISGRRSFFVRAVVCSGVRRQHRETVETCTVEGFLGMFENVLDDWAGLAGAKISL